MPTDRTPGPSEGRTSSSAGSRKALKVDTEKVAAALSGFLVIVAGGAAWVLSKRKLTLRPPTETERMDVALPAARILARHVDASWLSEDLTDGLEAAVAAVGYGQTKPLSKGLPVRQATPMPEGVEPL